MYYWPLPSSMNTPVNYPRITRILWKAYRCFLSSLLFLFIIFVLSVLFVVAGITVQSGWVTRRAASGTFRSTSGSTDSTGKVSSVGAVRHTSSFCLIYTVQYCTPTKTIHCIHVDTRLHGLINYICKHKSKCRHLKKFTCKRTLRQVFTCLRPPPLLGFCLLWSSNFEGSESGQIQRDKLLRNVISNWTQHPRRPSPPHTVQYQYQHDWVYLQSINSDKHLPQSPSTDQFFWLRHLLWFLYS